MVTVCTAGSVIGILLCFSADAAEGVRKGLVCACELLIPALFPFMVLSSFLIRSGLSDSIGRVCGWAAVHGLRLPQEAAAAVLLSFIGGFPVGAKCVRLLYDEKKLTAQQAEQMMLFCICSGPAFLITGIGVLLLHNIQAGIMLFAAQVLSGLILGFSAGRLFGKKPDILPKKPLVRPETSKGRWTEALMLSCEDGANALLQMTALVALFSMLSALSERTGVCELIKTVMQWCGAEYALSENTYYILTEVTMACQRIGSGGCPLWLLSAAVGFGGLCVHCQIFSIIRDIPLHKGKFFLFRLMNAFLSAGIIYIACQFYQPAAETFAVSGAVHAEWFSVTAAGTAAMVLMSVMFVLSLRRHRKITFPKRNHFPCQK